MKKIFIRSPYFIEVDEPGQSNAKIEIFLWNKGTTEPTTPNYTLTKSIASPTQTLIAWNISNFAKEFIKPIAPVVVTMPAEEDTACWCYMKVVRYSDNIELDDETFVCLNGYTQYSSGYNDYSNDAVIPLLNVDIKQLHNKYIDCWIDNNIEIASYSWVWNFASESDIDSDGALYKLPLGYSELNYLYEGSPETGTFFNVASEQICEPIYTPIVCTFINRFGGWQYLTFFKANQQSIDVTSKDYNLLHSSIDYNVLQGQKQRFNFQGKQKIKCNTGWVDENYSELIQDLLLSEIVLLDNKPAIVKSQSADIKTHLKDKNINYEIDFEFNYGLINDVI
jgi:hypothetical protein